MLLSEFDYELPPDRIAQQPLAQRDGSRLLWLRGNGRGLEDRQFRELPELLAPGDLLVANDSRVFPARLLGRRAGGGEGAVEVLLLAEHAAEEWDALVRPGRKLGVGARVVFAPGFEAEVTGLGERGERRLRFQWEGDFGEMLQQHGHMPLPPYIRRADQREDRERYQTVYAQAVGSAAAPTAGLHFTPAVLERLAARGVEWTTVSLHVGLGTFQSVESQTIEDHAMHREWYQVSPEAAAAVRRAQREGRRVIAVGTTAARVLESIAPGFAAGAGETGIFLYPGRRFQAVDAMITNFHAPRTTLLMMISALAGVEPVRRAYQHAIASGYRFLSYGDCMLIEARDGKGRN